MKFELEIDDRLIIATKRYFENKNLDFKLHIWSELVADFDIDEIIEELDEQDTRVEDCINVNARAT